jgi:site-specific DNA recombinase
MMRAAIYARFSSENQSASSIADQIEVCSRYIVKNGWATAATYSDAAMSGASRFRPGYQQLLADLGCGLFDRIVVEALDRLGRKLADVADLYDRCTFSGITLVAVNVGEITAMHIGLLGTMAQLYLSDLKQKTWRGQLGAGVARQGAGRQSVWVRSRPQRDRRTADQSRRSCYRPSYIHRICEWVQSAHHR